MNEMSKSVKITSYDDSSYYDSSYYDVELVRAACGEEVD